MSLHRLPESFQAQKLLKKSIRFNRTHLREHVRSSIILIRNLDLTDSLLISEAWRQLAIIPIHQYEESDVNRIIQEFARRGFTLKIGSRKKWQPQPDTSLVPNPNVEPVSPFVLHPVLVIWWGLPADKLLCYDLESLPW